MKLPGTRGRRCPSFSPARRCSAVFRDHFVSPTPASPYINTLCLYRCPEGAVDAPGPAAVSAGRPPSLRREAGGLNLAGGARAGPRSGGQGRAREWWRLALPALPPPPRPPHGRGGGERVAGSGPGWRREGRKGGGAGESGSCHLACGAAGARGAGQANQSPSGAREVSSALGTSGAVASRRVPSVGRTWCGWVRRVIPAGAGRTRILLCAAPR